MTKTITEKIQLLASDSVLPQRDRSKSVGRDAAFELFVGAVCSRAGLKPVRFEEPDITCEWKGEKLAIAAKRLKSAKKLLKRVANAVRQIASTRWPGIVFLDTTMMFNQRNERNRRPIASRDFLTVHRLILRENLSLYHDAIQRHMASANVLGLVVHDHQIRRTKGDWSLSSMTMSIVATGQSREQLDYFEAFFDTYTSALPNVSQ